MLFNNYVLSSDFMFPFSSVLDFGQVLISNKVHTHITTVQATFFYMLVLEFGPYMTLGITLERSIQHFLCACK